MLDHVTGDLFLKLFHKEGALRSWADDAHIPFQDIEKLRKLVQTCFADKFSDRRHSWIVRCGPCLFFFRGFLDLHRTELVHHKWFAVQADTLLFKDERPFRGGLYDDCDQKHRNGKEQDAEYGAGDVDRAFYKFIKRVGERDISHVYDRKAVQIFRVWSGWNDIVIIRDKFCVNS